MLGRQRGRDDRKVIGNFGVIENALVGLDPLIFQNLLRESGVLSLAQHAECLPDRLQVVFRQRA